MHQCKVCIIDKPGPDLYIADWLSTQNHKENKEIERNAIKVAKDIPMCISIQDIQELTRVQKINN